MDEKKLIHVVPRIITRYPMRTCKECEATLEVFPWCLATKKESVPSYGNCYENVSITYFTCPVCNKDNDINKSKV